MASETPEGASVIGRDLPLSWPSIAGAKLYRLCQRDEAARKTSTLYTGTDTSFVVPGAKQPAGASLTYRVEVMPEDESEYLTLVPFAAPSCEIVSEFSLPLQAPAAELAPAWRLIIRDEAADQVLIDRASFTRDFVLDKRELPDESALRYRFSRWLWREKKWEGIGAYRPLQFGSAGTTVQTSYSSSRRPDPAQTSRLIAMITIDTEASLRLMRTPDPAKAVDHQIFSRCDGGREVGINFIMDQLERRGARGTFFLDILMEYQFGRAELERVIEAIASRGHDIQLHVHPSPHLAYADDDRLFEACRRLTREAAPEEFARVMGVAVELFERRVGKAPIAFRNGSYHIHDSYFPILRAAGIRYDSTVYAFKNCRASPWIRGRVQPFEVLPGLWEIPLPWMIAGEFSRQRTVNQYTARSGPLVEASNGAYELLSWQRRGAAIFMPLILHSYSYLNEVRIIDPELGAQWNRSLMPYTPPERFRNLRRDVDTECLFIEGVAESAIVGMESQLGAISNLAASQFLAFDELDRQADALLKISHGATEAICETGARNRLTAVRRYPADLVRYWQAAPAEPANFARPETLPQPLRNSSPTVPTFEWKTPPGALRYRVSQRDVETKNVRLIYHGKDAWFAPPNSQLAQNQRYEYRVQALVSGQRYKTIFPYFPLRPPLAGQTVQCRAQGWATAYRIRVRTDPHNVFMNIVSLTPEFAIDPASLPRGKEMCMAFCGWEYETQKWRAITPFVALTPEIPGKKLTKIVAPAATDVTAYRLRVFRADKDDETIFVTTSAVPEFRVALADLPMSDELHVTFYGLDAESGAWRHLTRDASLKDFLVENAMEPVLG